MMDYVSAYQLLARNPGCKENREKKKRRASTAAVGVSAECEQGLAADGAIAGFSCSFCSL